MRTERTPEEREKIYRDFCIETYEMREKLLKDIAIALGDPELYVSDDDGLKVEGGKT